ncbi:hypothetical protein PV729_04320 [Streptomyces europaeiscabiei]|uniref:Uncharacterized protein n=1 Tax=Streptomyces europaeiscabiei TaxID=146819 RepID=A0ABU4N749_9ACTN|nr:hypothetical protein [Streptomyces europaeiscabiei]MDX3551003.1 hypothetical protein [Streptomyces europaeiscabiei]MDX3698437.1 hypothetical protein [Streptomyces europaeiscabiei]
MNFIVALVAAAASLALESWLAMLTVGALHSEVAQVPAISFSGAIWLAVLVKLLVGTATANVLQARA